MKVVVIGLGNFGAAVAMKLTEAGHEVVAADSKLAKVEALREVVHYAVTLDCSDSVALQTLPLHECELVIVAIGEDFGASIHITALLKNLKVKRIIARAITNIDRDILDAIGIEEVISPEEDAAERFVRRLDMGNAIDYLSIDDEYTIMEAIVPSRYVGVSIKDADLSKRHKINIITIRREDQKNNLFGKKVTKVNVMGVPNPEEVFQQDDILFIFGKREDIKKWLKMGE